MTKINSNNPTQQTSADLDAELQSQAASMVALGGIEGTIATISVHLDKLRDSSKATERQARQQRHDLKRAALGKKRKAAVLQMIAGVIGGATKVANGVMNAAAAASSGGDGEAVDTKPTKEVAPSAGGSGGGKGLETAGSIMNGSSDVATSVVGYFSSKATHEAEAHEHAAEIVGETAQQLDDLQESLQRSSDKAMSHLEKINEARNQAMMAAIRG